MVKPSIISIGAAVQDIFLQDRLFSGHHEKTGDYQEFVMGSKNEIQAVTFSTGGGATNASVTFARQGFDSYYLGRIAHDIAGKAVLEDLARDSVNTTLVGYSKDLQTGYSTILLAPNGERTILTYRGASQQYNLHPSDFKAMKPTWFYVSSLSGDLTALRTIIHYARDKGIKVAVNPGKDELAHHHEFRELLPHIAILSVNKEEAQKLFKGETSQELAEQAIQHVPVILITDGPKGSVASDGRHIYSAGTYEDVKVVDRAGAGDAFSSGFTAVLARGGKMEDAITFASANSTSVVTKIGAKTGILDRSAKLHPMTVQVRPL